MTLLSVDKQKFLLEQIQRAPRYGAIIEAGVYRGGSLKIIADACPNREVYGFDTFTGMPKDYYKPDEFHKPGEFQSSYDEVKALVPPHVALVKGVFPRSMHGVDIGPISFSHLDLDHWRGTLSALDYIWPRLLVGGVIVFDDYDWAKCAGITPLVDTWAAATNSEVTISGNQAAIRKRI